MNGDLIGYMITNALFWFFFGWKGLLFAAFFGWFAWFAPPLKTVARSNTYPFFLWSDADQDDNKGK